MWQPSPQTLPHHAKSMEKLREDWVQPSHICHTATPLSGLIITWGTSWEYGYWGKPGSLHQWLRNHLPPLLEIRWKEKHREKCIAISFNLVIVFQCYCFGALVPSLLDLRGANSPFLVPKLLTHYCLMHNWVFMNMCLMLLLLLFAFLSF